MKPTKKAMPSHRFRSRRGYTKLNPRLHVLFRHKLSLCSQSTKAPKGHIKHQPRPTTTKRAISSPHHTTQVSTKPKLKPGCQTPSIMEIEARTTTTSTGKIKRNWRGWNLTTRLIRPTCIRSEENLLPRFILLLCVPL